jgi:hypothetical protein
MTDDSLSLLRQGYPSGAAPLLPLLACGERVGVRGRHRLSAEAGPHPAPTPQRGVVY